MQDLIFRKLQFILLIAALVGVLGCVTQQQTQQTYYYTMEYSADSEIQELIQEESLNYNVWVRDAEVARPYSRTRIPLRQYGPRLIYQPRHLWAESLRDTTADIVAQRLQSYDLFLSTRRDYTYTRPDLEVNIEIHRLEMFTESGNRQMAFDFTIGLKPMRGIRYLVRHDVEEQFLLYDNRVDTFVQAVNEILLEETNVFVQEILYYYRGGRPGEIQQADYSDSEVIIETSDAPVGMGLLLLPDVSNIASEAQYTIVDSEGDTTFASFGDNVPLEAGTYTVRYGAGDESQWMEQEVHIQQARKTIIEPVWGGMIVEIVDSYGSIVDTLYEIFEIPEGNSFGSAYPVDRSIGELPRQWILEPGWYRVVIGNRGYNTRENYVDTYVGQGEARVLTLRVQPAPETDGLSLAAASVTERQSQLAQESPILFTGSFSTTANFISNNTILPQDYAVRFQINGNMTNALTVDLDPFLYTLSNDFQIEAASSDFQEFRVSNDEFIIENTVLYYVFPFLGVYGRADFSTHFFPFHYTAEENFSYVFQSTDGTTVNSGSGTDSVLIQPSFFPMLFQEGIGLNIRFLENPRVSVSLRGGFGFRQELNNDVFSFSSENGDLIFLEERNVIDYGIEAAFLADILLQRNISYTTRFDILFPFTDAKIDMEWENNLKLALFRNIFLDYRLVVSNVQYGGSDFYIVTDHNVLLGLSYQY